MRIALQKPNYSPAVEDIAAKSAARSLEAILEEASPVRGELRIVSVPIGDPDDISVRALRVLREADLIIAETLAVAQKFLQYHGVEAGAAKLVSLRPRQARAARDAMQAAIRNGRTVALLCDAGTPGIADPGSAFIRAALDLGAEVTACPGPCAALVALTASGLPTRRFVFEGFPPTLPTLRAALFLAIAQEPRTVILYESASRLHAALTELSRVCDPRRAAVLACDLTKPTEHVWRGSLTELRDRWAANPLRGQFVLLLGGLPQKTGA